MKASYKWLREYVGFQLDPKELAEKLSGLGMKVESMEETGDDVCFDFETLTSRPDTLYHIGIARDIGALLGLEVKVPKMGGEGSGKDVSEWTSVEIADRDLCPCYTARIISGVKVGRSPGWLTERLESVGMSPINNIVDVTNYVMMEMGQPLHAFDHATLEEGRIVVRRAKPAERLETIDHVVRTLDERTLVIADAKRAVAIAGVMGGLDTEVGEGTKVVLLESAHFEPLSIRHTARRLGLSTEASYRFERRIDPRWVDKSSRRAAELIREAAGGEIAKGVAAVDVREEKEREVTLRQARMKLMLGIEVPMEVAAGILKRLGFEAVEKTPEKVRVRVPSWRGDVEGEADLIEEVARVYGYDKVPSEPRVHVNLAPVAEWMRMETRTRELLVGMGYMEVQNVSLVPEDVAQAFTQWSSAEPLAVRNPVRAGEGTLRKSLLGSLLAARKTNQDHGAEACRLFEIARAYLSKGPDRQPEEKKLISILEDGDFCTIKGAVEELLEGLGVGEEARFEEAELDFLQRGQGARILLGDGIVGYAGRTGERLAERFELREAPYVCELDAEKVWAKAGRRLKYERLLQFPAMKRDLAVVVDEEVSWGAMMEEIERASSEIVRDVKFFDVYRGEGVPAGKKSMAFSITYRAEDRTLSRKQAEEAEAAILESLGKRFGAKLRGT